MDEILDNPQSAPVIPRWRRILFMRLDDKFPLRWTRRVTVPQLIAASELPAALGMIVQEVVRRARLWRREKIDVTRELIAHFQDGLASGASAPQLAGLFGDLGAAAKLIRRARKRQRPLWWRAMRRTMQGVGGFLLILLLIYLGLAIRFFTGRPGPVHDYLPQINAAALAAKSDERAWPLYREALLAMPELRSEQANNWWSRRPGDEDWAEVEQFLIAHQPQFELVRQGAARPVLGYVVDYRLDAEDRPLWPELQPSFDEHLGLLGVLMPYLQEAGRMAKTLALDARRAAADDDGETVHRNLIAIIGMARQVRQPATLISALISFASLQAMYDAAGELLAERPELFSEAQLRELAHALAGLRDEDLRVDFSTERNFFVDVVQRVYSDDGHGDGHLTRKGVRKLEQIMSWPLWRDEDAESWSPRDFAGPALLAVVADRREMLEVHGRFMDRAIAASTRPLFQQQDLARINDEISQMHGDTLTLMRYWPIALLMPALDHAAKAGEYAIAGRDGLQMAIALELYRRRHGQWPATLADLTPALIPAIPIDRFDGAPMRYALREGRPVLYSIGCNHRDDGGVLADRFGDPVEDNNAARRWCEPQNAARHRSGAWPSNWFVEGDWILWPPVKSRQ